MANEELVAAVKRIVSLSRTGNLEDAYRGYCELFGSPTFVTYRPEDQRQALRLMILAKGAPQSEARTEAHRAALAPLTDLVSTHHEPSDYELLGVCHVLLGNSDSADKIFREGLARERERNPSSDLCGSFMKRISFL